MSVPMQRAQQLLDDIVETLRQRGPMTVEDLGIALTVASRSRLRLAVRALKQAKTIEQQNALLYLPGDTRKNVSLNRSHT